MDDSIEEANDKTLEREAQLETHIQACLGSRVSELRIVCQRGGVVLRGRAYTFHAKQLVQHLAMKITNLPILANEIQVCLRDSFAHDNAQLEG